MIFECEEGCLAYLQVLVVPIASADPQANPIAAPKPSGSDILFFDSAPTRVGHKRRCRDMTGLSLCLCGESVQPGDVGSIRCQRAGCETIWVSNCVDFATSRLNLKAAQYYLRCVGYEDTGPQYWTCDACTLPTKSQQR